MARWFDAADRGFQAEWAAFLDAPRGDTPDVAAVVAELIADVRARGLEAVAEHSRRLDRHALSAHELRVDEAEIGSALAACDPDDLAALRLAADRIGDYHARQRPADQRWTDAAGIDLGWRWTPIEAAGLYVPGGRASYPSSVLMNAIPARVAGVERLIMTVPATDGVIDPLVLAAARISGVDEVWRIGGAQAVAALAYGAGPLRAVDKIVGPGNAYVAAAKRAVFGRVGIDTIAGPSEILVVSDGSVRADWIAIDLLSQAEHDPAAQAILITQDAGHARAVVEAVERWLEVLPTRAVAQASWRDHGAIVVVADLDREAPALVDQVAPEHVEIATVAPDALAARIRHAGSVFLGAFAPEALGDYVTGCNHVLPTSRSARFASGLSVYDFMKRTSIQRIPEAGLRTIGPAAARLARAERLPAHAASVQARLDDDG